MIKLISVVIVFLVLELPIYLAQIGVLLPELGKYQSFGFNIKQGLELCLNEINTKGGL
jgi:hypothetical protein